MAAFRWKDRKAGQDALRVVAVAACLAVALLLALAAPASVQQATTPPSAAIAAVHLSYVRDPADSIVVTWRSAAAGDDAWVEAWPTAAGGTGAAPGEATAVVGGKVTARGESHSYRYGKETVVIYDAFLDGLEPDTLYDYVIHCHGESSPVFSFRTAPDRESTKTVRFAVMGDSRGGYDVFGRLMRIARSEGASLVIFNGDMTDGASQPEWDLWFRGGGDTLPFLPLMPVHGNHEMMSQTYFKQFGLPGEEQYYSFEFGMLHFAVLLDNTEAKLRAQVPWLTSDLAQSHSRWKFVSLHKPIFSASPDSEGQTYPREVLEPVVEEQGVNVVFCGHVHNYERTVPLLKGKPADAGVVYLVTGGAGAPLVSCGWAEWTAMTASVNHVAVITASVDRLDAVVFTDEGKVIDQFTVSPRVIGP